MNLLRNYKLHLLGIDVPEKELKIIRHYEDIMENLVVERHCHHHPMTLYVDKRTDFLCMMHSQSEKEAFWCTEIHFWEQLVNWSISNSDTREFIRMMAGKYFGLGTYRPEMMPPMEESEVRYLLEKYRDAVYYK